MVAVSGVKNVTGKEERMRQGFVKVAAVTPKIRVADTGYNAKVICQSVKEAAEAGAKVIVLPELCITGYTCGDLFYRKSCFGRRKKNYAYRSIYDRCGRDRILSDFHFAYEGKLYNVAAALNRGKIHWYRTENLPSEL